MEVFQNVEDYTPDGTGTIATMGNFDGIHLGHQALVGNTVAEARQQSAASVVLTFEPHPLKLLAPDRAPGMILARHDKLEMLESFGVDTVIIQKFDRHFASITAEDFIRRCLVERLRLAKIWLGRDLRFGHARQGGAEQLIRWGRDLGFRVSIVEPILVEGIRISSSRIRHLIEAGRVDEVKPMLGRHHFVSGTVVTGHRRGRDLGFPTANLASNTEVIPRDGIYATLLELRKRTWLSVTSVGVNPTFGEGPRTVETFILDFAQDIYREPVKLFFVERIREQRKFERIDELTRQMYKDVEDARAIFDRLNMAV